MKAVIWTTYGSPDALKVMEIPKPEPKENEVLIHIHAASVSLADCEMRAMKLPVFFVRVMMRFFIGLFRPKRVSILGQEVAGVVEAVGEQVTKFHVGDRVFASLGFHFGGHAEYVCVPESSSDRITAHIPESMGFLGAATLPVFGVDAYHYLKLAKIQPGQHVLVNGAGGSIGTFGVQIAKAQGAEVTAVDLAEKHDMLRSIGADHVIDYTQQDFTQNGISYDVIFDVVGKCPFPQVMGSLKEQGCFVTANPSLRHMLLAKRVERSTGHAVFYQPSEQHSTNLTALLRLIQNGKVHPVIDRIYTIEQTAEAHRYVESGKKQGGVLLDIVDSKK
ncbi:MAG: NAD(P)-dependent alcohol dehydrogenase [Anaerolineae bacterium]|jgi:NADPH:quinone reductase-like Zn-dependent oxidoreductase|nr:NAD(P)-dependent alcohol dehydrogenase [Anaerolineae bacterium]